MAASKRPVSGDLSTVVKAGDLQKSLEALRDELARAVQEAPAGAKAQAAAQLRAVLADLAALAPPAKKRSKADELAARREARRATSDESAPAVGKGAK